MQPMSSQLIAFDVLPDDVLLEIFNFYVDEGIDGDFEPAEKRIIEEWITLAHVCRRWRSVIFQSPRRLNLRLLCTSATKRDTLDVWPPLLLIICADYGVGTSSVDNIIATLEHNERLCQIKLGCFSSSELEYVMNSAVMLKLFPELTHLWLSGPGHGGRWPILPDSFLGGTAPRLRSLSLDGVLFPGLPKLPLSATQLVNLGLWSIPHSRYIPPEAMATSLSALTSLEALSLDFGYSRPRPALESRRPPPSPLTRSVLPSLTYIRFNGPSGYLEEILARIDAPRLNGLRITFFNQITFDTPQLFRFISRSPTLMALEEGHIVFSSTAIFVRFPSQTFGYEVLSVEIPWTPELQLLSLEQVCTSSLPPVSTLEDLYIFDDPLNPPRWQDDVENTLWLYLLRSFVAVENLYISEEYVPRIAPALQELVGARTTEVLLTLENVFLEGPQPSGPLQEGIEKFVAARQLTNRPVIVSRWHRDAADRFY